jgi:ubiquitin-activating enzyme E1
MKHRKRGRRVLAEANLYLEDPAKYAATARSAGDHTARVNLESIVDLLATSRCRSFDECIALARRQFEDRFLNRIAQLVYTFPQDACTSNGTLFWSPPKRFPSVVVYNAEDPHHAQYMQAAAILFAELYGLEKPEWVKDTFAVAKRAAEVQVCCLNL